MTNLVFVIWMLGFPIVCSIEDYLKYTLTGRPIKKYSESTEAWANLLTFMMYIWVACLLYDK